MAISFIQKPSLILPTYNPIYVKVSSTKTAEDGYNFRFDLYKDGSYITTNRLLARPGTDEAIYTPARVLESYLSYDLSQNTINTSASTNCIDQYTVVCGEEYVLPWEFYDNEYVFSGIYSGYTKFYTTGATANPYVSGDTVYVIQDAGYTTSLYNGTFTVLSANSTSIIVNVKHTISTPANGGVIYYSDRRKTTFTAATATTSGYSFNAVIQYEEIPSWNYLQYIPLSGSTDAKFLTNQPSQVKIRDNEKASISYFNYGQLSGSSAINSILLTTYQKSGGTRQSLIVSSADADLSTKNTTNGLINHFGVGPWNLNQIPNGEIFGDVQPLIDGDRDTKYEVQLYNYAALPTSEIKTYIIDNECSKYEGVRFMFLNSLGAFDYYTATLVSRENVSISRTTYQKVLDYNYQVGDRGKTILDLDVQQSYIATSNWIDEETLAWLGELFWSTEVYVINSDGSLTPVVVDNSNYEPKKRVNDGLFNQQFTYTKAIKKNTQRN